MEFAGTAEQALVYLNVHWGRRYAFALPQAEGVWTATARYGDGDRLEAESPAVLLEVVRRHYRDHLPWAGKG
jgi:hypothetical protein